MTQVHDADARDAEGIAAIYNHAVRTGTAIWNDARVTVADRTAWLTDRQANGFPVLVVRDPDGSVAGYASYGSFRPHDGYAHTVELSIYVHHDHQGRGLGRLLMQALITRAQTAKVHVMVGGIEAGNLASIRLHEAFGFSHAGTLPQVGTKFGRWLDLAFLTLVLDDTDPAGRDAPRHQPDAQRP